MYGLNIATNNFKDNVVLKGFLTDSWWRIDRVDFSEEQDWLRLFVSMGHYPGLYFVVADYHNTILLQTSLSLKYTIISSGALLVAERVQITEVSWWTHFASVRVDESDSPDTADRCVYTTGIWGRTMNSFDIFWSGGGCGGYRDWGGYLFDFEAGIRGLNMYRVGWVPFTLSGGLGYRIVGMYGRGEVAEECGEPQVGGALSDGLLMLYGGVEDGCDYLVHTEEWPKMVGGLDHVVPSFS
ncbi:hypothetical protein Tco_1209331 [Tanacetum coccineum]